MTPFDASQQQVLQLDPARHARVLGAPGTGKTRLLVESFARLAERPGWSPADVMVIAPNRLVASQLRGEIERRISTTLSGTPARTAPSLAFAVLRRDAALRGVAGPTLLTGTAHDEIIEAVVDDTLEARERLTTTWHIPPQALASEAFRAELRELNRVLDDFALDPAGLLADLREGSGGAATGASERPEPELIAQWAPALELLAIVRARIERQRPGELTANAMIRAACDALRHNEQLELPRLVLVDDAGEMGEGAVALLAALADRGTRVWAFGDPDIATGAFSGERARVLAGVAAELNRRRAHHRAHDRGEADEQTIVLQHVHRHGAEIRALVTSLTGRIGAAGAGQQRAARAAESVAAAETAAVRFALAETQAEQVGMIAHQLRAAHLGLSGTESMPWSQMAVVCRSRAEVKRVSRILAGHQVPSSVAAGGVVLREHQLVRELVRLLLHSLGVSPLNADDIVELLTGIVGGLDPISLRRLRGALRLQEVRAAQAEGRPAVSADDLLLEAFQFAGDRPVLDMRAARQLMKLGALAGAATAVSRAGGTPREVLWEIWQRTGLAARLQTQALDARGTKSDDAHRALDGVVSLFFALQRHEEQDSARPVDALLDELMNSTVPQDSLAASSEREVVTVTTPQGMIGREYGLVCVLGLQAGAWPNLRARGSLLGVTALERWLRVQPATPHSRQDTMHDELRLFAQSVSRATQRLIVVAVANEDEHPSPFFTIGSEHRVERDLPSTRLTLRGVVAKMRRRLAADPGDREALDSLAALARAGVPGAHPDEWYGVLPLSTEAPLYDLAESEVSQPAQVPVSPSQMERAETCPLDWFVSRLAGGDGDYRANIGTLLHWAFETASPGATAEEIFEQVQSQWGSLKFEAEWQSHRARSEAEAMSVALSRYLSSFERSQRQLLANEASFEVEIEHARLRGTADRLEVTPATHSPEPGEVTTESAAGSAHEITVVDLKTGRHAPTARELEAHAQLQAYQLGALKGAFVDASGQPIEAAGAVNAKLLYVHPDALSKTRRQRGEHYLEVTQAGLTEAQQTELEQRVLAVARIMSGNQFVAQLEHHCEDPHARGRACAIHIVPAVSRA